MGEHVLPHRFQIGAVRLQRCDCGEGDALVSALFLQHIAQHGGGWSRITMAIEIDHIVEIAGPRTLAERTDLLAECFLVGVAVDPHSVYRAVCIGMKDIAPHRRQYEMLIRREVELDLRPAARA